MRGIMRINYNVSAMISKNALSNNDNLLAKSLERLSSGLKINHAKDNPAGLAIAKRMNAQLEGISKASENADGGISVIETADGALSEISEMIQRINELTVKASHGVLTDADRETIQEEINQLCDEIERIADTTEFNSQKLLDGTFDVKGYTDAEEVKVSYYSDEVQLGEYKMENVTFAYDADGNIDPDSFKADFSGKFPQDVTVTDIKDNIVTLRASGGFEMKLDLQALAEKGLTSINPNGTPDSSLTIDATGIGDMRLQVGSNEGQVLEIRIPKVSLRNMGIDKIDASTEEGAKDALSRMPGALAYISSVRSRLGAYQNRLESTVNNLDVTNENMTAAYSRIMDVDMAEEMTQYTTYQILTQAGTSMLAQANERPSQVLQLLQ